MSYATVSKTVKWIERRGENVKRETLLPSEPHVTECGWTSIGISERGISGRLTCHGKGRFFYGAFYLWADVGEEFHPPPPQWTRNDHLPMYGGMNRSVVPELKATDEKLIAETSRHYGSRTKAAEALVD